jgi:UDP-N-acetylmuramyl pentapeptide phosphotransferase/UDP-N-acetylglucosamine-1-phosphate transferase
VSVSLPLASVLLALVASALATDLARRIAWKAGAVAYPRPDRFHTRPVALLGGLGCLLGVSVAGLASVTGVVDSVPSPHVSPRWLAAGVGGTIAFALLGLLDDRRPLSPWAKGAGQGLLLALVLLIAPPGGRLEGIVPRLGAWIAGMMLLNAWNYLDHADGVFASVLAISAAVTAIVWGRVEGGGLPLALLWGSSGAMLGFLLWNLPPARIFLGDAGSLAMGFLLFWAGLALFAFAPAAALPATLAAHALAGTDFLLVSAARLFRGGNPFVGGRDHTGHRLGRAVGPLGTLALCAAGIVGFAVLGFATAGRPAWGLAGILLLAVLVSQALRLLPPPLETEPQPAKARKGRSGSRSA